jgi:hypothetical protein
MPENSHPSDPQIQEILAAFQPNDRIYKRQAVEAALARQEEIFPYLIEILEDTLARPVFYLDQGFMSPLYAFMLLGHFKEAQAHPLIVDLFSLPEELIDPLFGDLITEDLATVLFRTCAGSVDQIKRLILNKAAYEYCRGAAVTALSYAAIEGVVSREETLEFFGSLFTGAEDDNPDSAFWAMVANAVYDLYPEPLMPVIEQAFERDLIDQAFIGPESFSEALAAGQEETLQSLRQEVQSRSLDDLHQAMDWWAMFEYKSEEQAQAKLAAPRPTRPSAKQHKVQKKKKRKQSRAARKKSRRK